MTDNEIIKALESCSKHNCCNECPNFHTLCEGDSTVMVRKALDLINRQKAEIEQWKEEANRYQNLWCEAEKDLQIVKSEARKEFAELVKLEFYREFDELIPSIMAERIDNLLEEMESKS